MKIRDGIGGLKKLLPVLPLFKYAYAVWITFLAARMQRDARFFVCGLLEFASAICFSYAVFGINRLAGQALHFLLYFLYAAQMLVLYFGSMFTSLVMMTNLVFAEDLGGKTLDYAKLAVPMALLLFVPLWMVPVGYGMSAALAAAGVLLLAAAVLPGGGKYSALYNSVRLCRDYLAYRRMLADRAANVGNPADFCRAEIADGIKKPEALSENPNIILIFTEGLSAHVLTDGRNVMPAIKALMGEAVWFSDYYDHTFATLRGLSGQLFSGYQLANLDKNCLVSIQSILRERGYRTVFINTEPANRVFTEYLTALGFDELVCDPAFAEAGRFMSDKEAFSLLFDTISGLAESGRPYFAAIYTFGTHVSFDSPDEKFGDGKDAMLNRFFNADCQFSAFFNRLKESGLAEDTLLVYTADHAVYADADFRTAFPDHDRVSAEVDAIPLLFWHEGIQARRVDARGRNSLCLAPALLDYLDIQAENYFLGTSLFASEPEGFSCETVFSDSTDAFSTKDGQVRALSKGERRQFDEFLRGYFSINTGER